MIQRGTRRVDAVFLALCLTIKPVALLAHVEGDEVTGLWSGLLHPVSGLDHVVAMVAVGVWGAQLGAPAMWLLPVTFPLVMACGGMAGLVGIHVPAVEFGIAGSAVVLGALVVSETRAPVWLAILIVGVFAVFHGHAHGTELPDGANGLLYSIGFVTSTGTLHGLGIVLGLLHRWSAGRLLLRVAGAAVAATGLTFLAGVG